MLPKNARLTDSAEFTRATKNGLRASSQNFIGYLLVENIKHESRAGLIVGKSVGGSVIRHRVARQVRHALAERIVNLPDNSLFVIRALGAAAKSNIFEEISSIIDRVVKKSAEVKK